MTDEAAIKMVRSYNGSIYGMHGPSVLIEVAASEAQTFQSFTVLSEHMPEIFLEGSATFHRPSAHHDLDGLAQLAKFTIHAMRYAGIPLRLEFSIRRDRSDRIILSLPAIHSKVSFDCFKFFLDRIAEAPEGSLEGPSAEAFLRDLISHVVMTCRPFALRRQNPKNLIFAAYNLGLPVSHISETYVGIGRGAGYRRFVSSFSEDTSVIGVNTARCKHQTAQLLKRHGLPVAQQIPLGINDDPITAAEKIGYPVVVKPSDRDGGQGVHAGVKDSASLLRCLTDTRKHSNNVLIEKFHAGHNYRITLCNDVVLSSTRKLPGGVLGDGVSGVAALIAAQHQDCGTLLDPYEDYKPPLAFDDEVAEILAERDMNQQTVLQEGEFLALRRRTNAITGGSTLPLDIRDIHPENLELFREAARLIGLDICGVDYISEDISRPWHEVGGIIVEINAQPQMGYRAAYALLQEFTRSVRKWSAYLMLYRAGEYIGVDEIRRVLLEYDITTGINGNEKITRESISKRAFRSEIGAIVSALQDKNNSDVLCVCSDWEIQQWGFPLDHFNYLFVHPSMNKSEVCSLDALEVLARPYAAEIKYLGA